MSNDTKSTTKYLTYPKPEAEYQQIIENPIIFLEKLQGFHVFYGTKFRVPTIAGNSLDLHQLFVAVTSRGGIEKVIRDRRWKEITGAFNFPSSITSASFVLRKYYISLLYHFEQVYYFRKEEPSILETDQASRIFDGSTLPHSEDIGASPDELMSSPNFEDGIIVTGIIDGKFDDGYLVTVKIGSEDLKGVLYHTPVHVGSTVSQTISTSSDSANRTKRKQQVASRDPGHPKPNRSGYTFFFAEQYAILRPLYHGQEKDISKNIGQLWSRLSEAEKQVYQEKGMRDKERYKAEMLEYKSSSQVQGY